MNEIAPVLNRDRQNIEDRNFADAEELDGHGGRINVRDESEER